MARTNEWAGLLVIAFIVCFAMAALFGPVVGQVLGKLDASLRVENSTITHAPERHPNDYGGARECIRNASQIWQLMIRPSKFVLCAEDGDKGYAFQPFKQTGGAGGSETFEEITAYHRTEIQTFDDLCKYADEIGVKVLNWMGVGQ